MNRIDWDLGVAVAWSGLGAGASRSSCRPLSEHYLDALEQGKEMLPSTALSDASESTVVFNRNCLIT